MAFEPDSLALAVMERIADLFSQRVPWPQRLWRSSSLDAVRHCVALVESNARDGAKSYALAHARHRIEGDLFIPRDARGSFLKPLQIKPEKLVLGGANLNRIRSLEGEMTACYWDWIASFLASLTDTEPVKAMRVDADVLSWQIAAHIRACGMSDRWIANFTTFQLKYNPSILSLTETMELARTAVSRGSGWVFLIPIKDRRGFNVESPPLLSGRHFENRFRELFPQDAVPANRGGIELRADVIDKYAAIEQVELGLQRVMDRYRSSTSRRRLSPHLRAWVSPGAWQTDLSLTGIQRIRFRQLDADGAAKMFIEASEELEAAIDLLIAGDRTSVRAASIAAWAALETLLADESDYGELATVADRAAAILTCLYVRDAYWSIATGHARAGTDHLAVALRGADAAGRATMVEDALETHDWVVSPTLGQISLQRVRLISSAAGVRGVHGELSAALHRLYDVRNQIVHAGQVEPFGLQTTYSASAILLSALVDELLVQSRKSARSAREVAGQASWLIDRVSEQWATPSSLASL